MLIRKPSILWLAPLALACPGCVMSLSPLPASYGPPQWQGVQQMGFPAQQQGVVVSTPTAVPPSSPAYPAGTPAPTRDLGPLPPAIEREAEPGPLEVPDLRDSPPPVPVPARPAHGPRRFCALPE